MLSIAAVLIREITTPIASSPILLSSAYTGEITIIFLVFWNGSNSTNEESNPFWNKGSFRKLSFSVLPSEK